MLQDPSTGTAVKQITFDNMPKTTEQQILAALLRIEKLLADRFASVRVDKALEVAKEFNEKTQGQQKHGRRS